MNYREKVILAGFALAFTCLFSGRAQMEYPPETHAIPIPPMDSLPRQDGPFQGTWESLKQYQCPDWFRDGKFGIWAHWGPQAVPGDGDWYAMVMYQEGTGPYEDHLKIYGHPSKAGYKDILPLWTAEKWDPDRLMALYKAAGAHYFVAQAVHHDNFDNWNSKYHKWNSVNMGPHKDIVGLWEKAARKLGLRFGVSEHLGHGFTFMQPAHGSDKKGPMAGVPYDGANPAYWDLYQMPAKPGDSGWYSSDPRWAQEWYARMYDLIDQYKPDLLYSDGGLPFGSVGRNIVAQLYNVSIENNGGKLEAVYNCKKNYFDMSPFVDGTCVQDCERGIMTDIQPYPWQTDTSTGDWFYNKHDGYKSSSEVIHTLTDIVSKNGNLLLNVVLYPDGSLPPQMETFLSEMADWMKINGEAIFGTKPWVVCGEGSTTVKGGTFDNESFPFTAKDIRFTRKGNDIYATTLGLPSGQTVIRALASNSPLVSGNPTQVSLLGATENLKWTRTTDGMVIQLPDTMPCKAAVSFKISGLTTNDVVDPNALSAFKEILSAPALSEAGPDGSFQLPAAEARLHGSTIRIDGSGDSSNIGWWQKPEDTVSWRLKVAKPGTYNVSINMASQDADSEFVVAVDSEQLEGKSTNTGGYYRYQTVDVGTIMIENAGATTITIRPKSPASWKPFNVRSVILKPE